KARAAIFLSLDELWDKSDEMGLKASILDPCALKLLSFATVQEREDTEAQIYSLSAELWGSFSISDQATTEDEFTRYMKEQIAHKNQNPLI
ncbi:22380_t:CDS:2, partial [Racocetra persica]